MLTFQDAQEIARSGAPGKPGTRIASYAGGRSRVTKWHEYHDTISSTAVDVELMGSIIATFTADGVRVWTCGHNTASTFEALNATLGMSFGFYNERWQPLYRGTPMTEGMLIGYDGVVLEHTDKPTPQRKRHGRHENPNL